MLPHAHRGPVCLLRDAPTPSRRDLADNKRQPQSHGHLHGDQAVRGAGAAVRRHAVGDVAPGLGRPLPDAPRPRRVHAHLLLRRRREDAASAGAGRGSSRGRRRTGADEEGGDYQAEVPGRGGARRAGGRAGALLPVRGSDRGGRAGAPRRAVLCRGRLLRGGRRQLHPRRRQLPGAAATPRQGAARAVPDAGALARRAAQQPRHDTGHDLHLRRLRGGPAHQPRGGGRHGRGAVPERRRRPRPRAAGAPREAHLGPGPLPRPGHQARPAPGAAGAGAGVHRVRLPHRVPGQAQVAVRGVHGRQDLLGLRHRHRQAVAVPDAYHHQRRRRRRRRQALLLRQRAPRAEAGAGLLRQRHLPRQGAGAGGEGGRLFGGRACGNGPGGEAADGRGVPELGRGPHRRTRPVPDDLQLRVRVRVGLEQARVRRRGLRVRRAGVRRPAGELRPHRVGHRHEGARAARRHAASRQLRHQGARRRLRPQDARGPRLIRYTRARASMNEDEGTLPLYLLRVKCDQSYTLWTLLKVLCCCCLDRN